MDLTAASSTTTVVFEAQTWRRLTRHYARWSNWHQYSIRLEERTVGEDNILKIILPQQSHDLDK